MESRTLIVVSANRLYAEAAAAYLEGREGWTIRFVSMDGLHALDAARRLKPSAVLVIGEPDRIGSRALWHQLLRRDGAINVVVVGGQHASASESFPADIEAESVMTALRDGGGRSHSSRPRPRTTA